MSYMTLNILNIALGILVSGTYILVDVCYLTFLLFFIVYVRYPCYAF